MHGRHRSGRIVSILLALARRRLTARHRRGNVGIGHKIGKTTVARVPLVLASSVGTGFRGVLPRGRALFSLALARFGNGIAGIFSHLQGAGGGFAGAFALLVCWGIVVVRLLVSRPALQGLQDRCLHWRIEKGHKGAILESGVVNVLLLASDNNAV